MLTVPFTYSALVSIEHYNFFPFICATYNPKSQDPKDILENEKILGNRAN